MDPEKHRIMIENARKKLQSIFTPERLARDRLVIEMAKAYEDDEIEEMSVDEFIIRLKDY